MNDTKMSVIVDSSTALFCVFIVLVLRIHRLFSVHTVWSFKVGTVVLYNSTEHLRFNLLDKILESISIDEKAFLRGMRMQIEEKIDPSQGLNVFSHTPN